MTQEIRAILATCSRDELDALRAIGMNAAKYVRPAKFESLHVPARLALKTSERSLWKISDPARYAKYLEQLKHYRRLRRHPGIAA